MSAFDLQKFFDQYDVMVETSARKDGELLTYIIANAKAQRAFDALGPSADGYMIDWNRIHADGRTSKASEAFPNNKMSDDWRIVSLVALKLPKGKGKEVTLSNAYRKFNPLSVRTVLGILIQDRTLRPIVHELGVGSLPFVWENNEARPGSTLSEVLLVTGQKSEHKIDFKSGFDWPTASYDPTRQLIEHYAPPALADIPRSHFGRPSAADNVVPFTPSWANTFSSKFALVNRISDEGENDAVREVFGGFEPVTLTDEERENFRRSFIKAGDGDLELGMRRTADEVLTERARLGKSNPPVEDLHAEVRRVLSEPSHVVLGEREPGEIIFSDDGKLVSGDNVLQRIIGSGNDGTVIVKGSPPPEILANLKAAGGNVLRPLPGTVAFGPDGKPLGVVPVPQDLTPPTFPTGLPLFELAPNVCNTMLPKDRDAMLADMLECDLLHLPFPSLALRFNTADIMLPHSDGKGKEYFVTCAVSEAQGSPLIIQTVGVARSTEKFSVAAASIWSWVEMKNRRHAHFVDLDREEGEFAKLAGSVRAMCLEAVTTLLIALATRNVVKSTERNTRISNKHKQSKLHFEGPRGAIYISTTRLEAPDVSDMVQEHGTHASPRAHLRRGHAHTVLYGVGRRERRTQWFPAVWVNGDPGFMGDGPRKYVVQH